MSGSKQDIRGHGDEELSLLVMNDEALYNMRRNRKALIFTLNDLFIFNESQLDVLKQDLKDDAQSDTGEEE